jgi:hypothetical protein
MIPSAVEVASIDSDGDRTDMSCGTCSRGVLLHHVPDTVAEREDQRGQRQKEWDHGSEGFVGGHEKQQRSDETACGRGCHGPQ